MQPGSSAGSFDAAAGWLAPLTIATLTKFAALAVYAALVDMWALRRPSRGWSEWLLGLALLALPATLVGAVDPHRLGFLMALTFLLFAMVLFGVLMGVVMRPAWALGPNGRLSEADKEKFAHGNAEGLLKLPSVPRAQTDLTPPAERLGASLLA
jgi:hypothetical protein